MTGLDVAVSSDEFSTGPAGELMLRGPNRDAAYTGSADLETWNALHIDPAGGAWVARRDLVPISLSQKVLGGGADVGAAQKYTWPVQSTTIHNACLAQSMVCLLTYTWAWETNLTEGSFADFHGSARRDNAVPSWRHIGTQGAVGDWHGSHAETDLFFIAPGVSSTIYLAGRILNGAGARIDANSCTLTIRGLGITCD